jgi:glyoxylase-like metal-dependent hydrolase (beta-lactamase superfamily II)
MSDRPPQGGFAALADALGLQLLQRDWLSANNIVFAACGDTTSAVVDTGYARHAPLTSALVSHALKGAPLARIINTHLHSDHCGGNHHLQSIHQVQTHVPAPSLQAVQAWDEDLLTYRTTGQFCERFEADHALHDGDVLDLGAASWRVVAAPGHDPDALMLFEPQSRTLIAGDALWEDRLAIIFPELEGGPGFQQTRATLALIEQLAPRWVIPGHGRPFEAVDEALRASRQRLDAFEANPARHTRHAARALLMFHMMEHQLQGETVLHDWLLQTPLFMQMCALMRTETESQAAWASRLVQGLVDDGLLVRSDNKLHLSTAD